MAAKYIIRKRRNKILYTETLIVAVIIGFVSIKYYQVHPAIALVIALAAWFLLMSLFFANRIFRYSFSILFSIIWGLVAFIIGQFVEKSSDTTAWVFGILAFGFSLFEHKQHFSFLKDSEYYEYEVR
jgi:hypothetical protein